MQLCANRVTRSRQRGAVQTLRSLCVSLKHLPSSSPCHPCVSYLHLVSGGAGSAGGRGEEEVPSREETEGAYHWTGGGHQYCCLR